MSRSRRPLVKVAIAASLLAALYPPAVEAQTLPEMFQRLKSEVHARSWNEALRTLSTLQTEAAKPGNEDARAKLDAPIAFYRGVCEANLGQSDQAVESFVTFLDIRSNATLDSATYSRETVAAFEQARKTVADRAPSLAVAYKSFEPPADASGRDRADKFWADGPVRWILTAEEKNEWSSLTDPNAREAFVERFWTERSTLPGSSGRTYREEFERRVAFADTYLVQEAEQRGSLTDRGMVLILLGPPKSASRRALRSGEDPSEPSGLSRVESQEAKIAMKSDSGKSPGSGGGPDHHLGALPGAGAPGPLDGRRIPRDLALRLSSSCPAGFPSAPVDVHYVTKKSGGKNVLQRDIASNSALGAARKQQTPRSSQ